MTWQRLGQLLCRCRHLGFSFCPVAKVAGLFYLADFQVVRLVLKNIFNFFLFYLRGSVCAPYLCPIIHQTSPAGLKREETWSWNKSKTSFAHCKKTRPSSKRGTGLYGLSKTLENFARYASIVSQTTTAAALSAVVVVQQRSGFPKH